MCRLDIPPPLEPILYVHFDVDEPQDADEIISIGDADMLIGVRRNLEGQASPGEYSCVGLGWNAGFHTRLIEDDSGNLLLEDYSGKTYLEHADLVKKQIDDGLESPILRQVLADIERFGLMRCLREIRTRKAADEDVGDDGTPVLFWIEVPQGLFWYTCQWEQRRRGTAELGNHVDNDIEDIDSLSSGARYTQGSWE